MVGLLDVQVEKINRDYFEKKAAATSRIQNLRNKAFEKNFRKTVQLEEDRAAATAQAKLDEVRHQPALSAPFFPAAISACQESSSQVSCPAFCAPGLSLKKPRSSQLTLGCVFLCRPQVARKRAEELDKAKRQALEEDAKARALAFNVKQVEKVKSTELGQKQLEEFRFEISTRSDRSILGCVVSSNTPPAFRASFPPNHL